MTEEEWRQPWMTDEWIEEWKSFDHTWCTRFGLDLDTPDYIQCRSMHCPHCNKSCGGQGHFLCEIERS